MDGTDDKPEHSEYLDLSEEWSDEATQPVDVAQRTEPVAAAAGPNKSSTDRPTKVQGIAREINIRDDPSQQQRLTFRIDRYDDEGNRLPPVPVELRRYRGGIITDGDEVEVKGHWSAGTLIASRIRNHSMASEVRGWFPRSAKWIVLAGVLLILVALAVAGLLLRNNSNLTTKAVPAVAGQTEAEAVATIRDAGFKAATTTEPSEDVAAGIAIRTEPPEGFSTQPGATVTVVVSSGPFSHATTSPPTPATPPPTTPPTTAPPTTATPTTAAVRTVLVPDVRFQPEADAARQLSDAGLAVKTADEPNADIPQGNVVRTDPQEGTSVPNGSTVTVYVSSGP